MIIETVYMDNKDKMKKVIISRSKRVINSHSETIKNNLQSMIQIKSILLRVNRTKRPFWY